MRLLAEDAVLYTDSGGKATAVRAPIRGAGHIVRLFLGLVKKRRRGWRCTGSASTASRG
ncbi:MAG: hypothetical protein JO329_16115 [Planctomycetaceae bacterium]|nr:hypothetical protein [Planctomycetaceae bacterium]